MIDTALGKHGSTKATEVADQIIVARMQGRGAAHLCAGACCLMLPACFSVISSQNKDLWIWKTKKKERSRGRAVRGLLCEAERRLFVWRHGCWHGVPWGCGGQALHCWRGRGGTPARPGGSCGCPPLLLHRQAPPYHHGALQGQLATPRHFTLGSSELVLTPAHRGRQALGGL